MKARPSPARESGPGELLGVARGILMTAVSNGATRVVLAYINGTYTVEYLSDTKRVNGESLPRDAGLAAAECLLSMAGLSPGNTGKELNGSFAVSLCDERYAVFVFCPSAKTNPQLIVELDSDAD